MIATSELLSRFTNAADANARRAALINLVKEKRLHRVASDEGFKKSLVHLALSLRETVGDIEHLLTLAALQRVAAAASSIRTPVESLMSDAVAGPLSKLHEVPNVQDRFYAAQTWRVVPNAWRIEDLATAAVREVSGEKVRKECIAAVIALAEDSEKAITALRTALLQLTFKTKKPGDSLGRRLNRVLVVLTEAISRSHKPVGAEPGREIDHLVRRGFRATGRPETRRVRTFLVEEVALLTHAIIRADFSQAGNDHTYAALSGLRHWFSAREWEDTCGSSNAISRVRGDVEKAVVFLASAGKTDGGLRSALATVAGSRKNADAICRTIATEHVGIPDDVRYWLSGVSTRIQSTSAVESQARSIDQILAELLIANTKLSRASSVVRSDVLPEVSIVLPQSVPALSRLAGLADAMADTLSLAVMWRSLRLRGSVGEEVEFTPVDHQFNTTGVHSRRVRLLSPLVERVSEDGVPRVVLKATVEPLPERRKPTNGVST